MDDVILTQMQHLVIAEAVAKMGQVCAALAYPSQETPQPGGDVWRKQRRVLEEIVAFVDPAGSRWTHAIAKQFMLRSLLTAVRHLVPGQAEKMVAAESIRDAAVAYVQAHEAIGCPKTEKGKVCWDNRTSFVGYMMHCLGMTAAQLGDVARYMDDYNKTCNDGACPREQLVALRVYDYCKRRYGPGNVDVVTDPELPGIVRVWCKTNVRYSKWVMPHSEVVMHFGLAGKPMDFELVEREGQGVDAGRKFYSAQLYRPGTNEKFSGTITTGECGMYYDGQAAKQGDRTGYYFYPNFPATDDAGIPADII